MVGMELRVRYEASRYNEAKQQEFLKILESLRTDGNPLYFLDEIHPEHQSKADYGWIYKGSNKAILTTATQKRVHLFGALSFPDRR